MSCKAKFCYRNAVKSIKFDALPCAAHIINHDDLDHPFAVVMLNGVAYMELAICPATGSGFTALFEITEADNGYGVIVPDYVADLNEKFLNDLDIIPIIADDPEFEDENEDVEVEEEQEGSDEDLIGTEELSALDYGAKDMLVAALKTSVGRNLFQRYVAADSKGEELHWLNEMVDFVIYLDSQNTTQPDSGEEKHSCKGCGKCKSESGKVGSLGAGMIGMRIGDMPKKIQDILKAQLGAPSEEEDKVADTKVNVPVNPPANKPCASGVRWNEEEDKELLKLGVAVGCFGISWDDVATKLGRTPDACRKRFYKIKGIQK